MLSKALVRRPDLFEFFLRIVPFTFEDHERPRQLVRHLSAPAFKFFLAPAQLFQFALLFLDLLRLPLQLHKLLLCFLHLEIEMLRRHRLFFAQLQHLFDRSYSFCHGNRVRRIARSGTMDRARLE